MVSKANVSRVGPSSERSDTHDLIYLEFTKPIACSGPSLSRDETKEHAGTRWLGGGKKKKKKTRED